MVRLCKRDYDTLDGIGASKTGGRWTSPGLFVTYTASCGTLAILEYTAHLSKLPSNMTLLSIDIPATLQIQIGRQIEIGSWTPGDPLASRQIGDKWIESASTVVLQVPSVLAPGQKNYLINAKHRLFGAVKIVSKTPFAFDSRLLSSIPPPVRSAR